MKSRIGTPPPSVAEASAGHALSAADAYRLWAPIYERETAVSALEDRVVRGLGSDLHGRTLLDVGCGTGRRLPRPESGQELAVGVDLVAEMLAQAPRGGAPQRLLAAADVRCLPLRPETFDLVWCRLVLGHVTELVDAYAEVARVSREGAELVVTDFHPRAVAAGHRRSFRDAAGTLHEVEHHAHTRRAHEQAAAAAGWRRVDVVEASAGEEERRFYVAAGRLDQLEAERDLPLILALRYTR